MEQLEGLEQDLQLEREKLESVDGEAGQDISAPGRPEYIHQETVVEARKFIEMTDREESSL